MNDRDLCLEVVSRSR